MKNKQVYKEINFQESGKRLKHIKPQLDIKEGAEHIFTIGAINPKDIKDLFHDNIKEINVLVEKEIDIYPMLKDLDERVYITSDLNDFTNLLTKSSRIIPNYQLIVTPNASKEFAEKMVSKFKIDRQAFTNGYFTTCNRTRQWTENILTNMAKNKGYKKLARIYNEDQSVLAVGAGPSLNDEATIRVIKNWKGLIYVCSHALKFLEKLEVYPDYVFVLEAMDTSAYLTDNTKNYRLVCTSTVHPAIINREWKEIIMVGDSNPLIEVIIKQIAPTIKSMHPGPSVMTFLTKAAIWQGAKDVFYIGQDLAFTEDEQYAEGLDRIGKGYGDMKLAEWTSKDGKGKVSIAPPFLSSLFYLGRLSSDHNILDLSTRGASIPGVPWYDSREIKTEDFPTEKEVKDSPPLNYHFEDFSKNIIQIIDNKSTIEYLYCCTIQAFSTTTDNKSRDFSDLQKGAKELKKLLVTLT